MVFVRAGRGTWALLAVVCALVAAGPAYSDRFVWIFGWGLEKDSDVQEIEAVLETAAAHGFNGAVMAGGFDSLSTKSPDYFRRLDEVKQAADRLDLELIPSVFSVGYGGVLGQDPNLAEGLPVDDALFVVNGAEARLVPDPPVALVNGGFEDFNGFSFMGYRFYDGPGKISFPDTQVYHSGHVSIRFENFGSDPFGHARIMQQIKVHPHRVYRMSIWVKTEGLKPASAFQLLVLGGKRELAPREFNLPPTGDWKKLTLLFNSLEFDTLNVYAGLWGGQEGKFWLDDWSVEEVGPIDVLQRSGTPVTVRSDDGTTTYEEGKDYAPLSDPNFSVWNVNRAAPPLKLLAGSRIQNGQRLRVSWYHPMVIYDSQVTLCMEEPKLFQIWEQESKILWEHLHPRRFVLSMDEIRMGGTCELDRGRDMAKVLGETVTKQEQILRRLNPQAEIYIWSDMLDPNHNAHGDYYLVNGDFTGSWNYVPKDLVIAVWGGKPRQASLKFFSDHSFKMLIANYYDAENLDDVKEWQRLAVGTPGVVGFMYTTWGKNYTLLPDYGDLLFR